MTHKLKTPLTAINGFSAVLLDKFKNVDEKTSFALQAINKQGFLLNELVDSLLRFTLLESEYTKYNMQDDTISNIIDKSIKGLNEFISKVDVKIGLDSGMAKMPKVSVDTLKVIEAVESLIENAVKFNNKPNKKVIISAKETNDGFVTVEVADNGPGVPPEEYGNIFQKFYQIDEYQTGQVKGVGLGLPLVKRVVDFHGGKVWVESKIGEGSRFFFTLPVSKN
jgi:two-component system OmpR family sensor kinase